MTDEEFAAVPRATSIRVHVCPEHGTVSLILADGGDKPIAIASMDAIAWLDVAEDAGEQIERSPFYRRAEAAKAEPPTGAKH